MFSLFLLHPNSLVSADRVYWFFLSFNFGYEFEFVSFLCHAVLCDVTHTHTQSHEHGESDLNEFACVPCGIEIWTTHRVSSTGHERLRPEWARHRHRIRIHLILSRCG